MRLHNVTTASEALEQAGMNFKVGMRPIFIQDKAENYHEVPDRLASVRRDTGQVFGVFSNQYQPVQWSESTGIVDPLVQEFGAEYYAADMINNGAKGWLEVRLPGVLKIDSRDWLDASIIIKDSYDGGWALHFRGSLTRRFCANQFAPDLKKVALEGHTRLQDTMRVFKFRHTGNMQQKLDDARRIFSESHQYFDQVLESVQKMAVSVPPDMDEFLTQLFGQEESPEEISTRVRNQMNSVDRIYREDGIEIAATRWGVYNAVTQFVDHERGPEARRSESALFGSGAELKQRAWDLLAV